MIFFGYMCSDRSVENINTCLLFLAHSVFFGLLASCYFLRAKYHKLKYGSELVQGGGEPPPGLLDDLSDEGRLEAGDTTAAILASANTNASWKQSRQLLRQ